MSEEETEIHPAEPSHSASQPPLIRALSYIGLDLTGPSPATLFEKLLAVLYIFVPITFIAEFLHLGGVVVFITASLAIIPLAKLLGTATEELAARTGPGIGGLLNATFGNAVELMIAFFALQAGLTEVVKASITGSIIGNILFVLGLALFLGGLGRSKQTFNRTVGGASASQAALATAGLVIPAVFVLTSPQFSAHIHDEAFLNNDPTVEAFSIGVAIVLLLAYAAQLVFSLRTHRKLYDTEDEVVMHGHAWSVRHSVIVLVLAAAVTGFIAEFLVGSIEFLTTSLGLTELFVGVILVAIIGNAAEHLSAVTVAIKNKMDLSVNIAMGSTLQIALFVAPVLVLVGYFTGNQMSLVFSTFELVAIIAAVGVANAIISDGETNWFEGLQLLALYGLLGLGFFFHP